MVLRLILETIRTEHRYILLLWLTESLSMFQLIKLLLDSGAEVDIRDNQDRTPLHFAVVANKISANVSANQIAVRQWC